MNIQILSSLFIVWALSLSGCAHSVLAVPAATCETSVKRQGEISAKLLEIVKEDQADRAGSFDLVDWNKVNSRDMQRRIQES